MHIISHHVEVVVAAAELNCPTQLQLAGSFHIFHQEIKSRLNQPVAAATTTNNKRHHDIIVHIHSHTRPIIDMMVWIESD